MHLAALLQVQPVRHPADSFTFQFVCDILMKSMRFITNICSGLTYFGKSVNGFKTKNKKHGSQGETLEIMPGLMTK